MSVHLVISVRVKGLILNFYCQRVHIHYNSQPDLIRRELKYDTNAMNKRKLHAYLQYFATVCNGLRRNKDTPTCSVP